VADELMSLVNCSERIGCGCYLIKFHRDSSTGQWIVTLHFTPSFQFSKISFIITSRPKSFYTIECDLEEFVQHSLSRDPNKNKRTLCLDDDHGVQDGPTFMAEDAKAYKYPFPYLYDEVSFWSSLLCHRASNRNRSFIEAG